MEHGLPGFSVHGIFPGKNTGVGCHALLQGFFQTQGSNPSLLLLLHWQVGSLPLAPPGFKHLSPLPSFNRLNTSAAAAKSLQSCPTLVTSMDCSPPGSSVHGIFPGKNTGVGWHFLLQGIFPTQELNPGLLHYRQILYRLSYEGSPMTICV